MKDFHKKNTDRREADNRKRSVIDELEELRQELRNRKSKAKQHHSKGKIDSAKENSKDQKRFKSSFSKEDRLKQNSTKRNEKGKRIPSDFDHRLKTKAEKAEGFRRDFKKLKEKDFSQGNQATGKENHKTSGKENFRGKRFNKDIRKKPDFINQKGKQAHTGFGIQKDSSDKGVRSEKSFIKNSLRRKGKGFENDNKSIKKEEAFTSQKKSSAVKTNDLIRLNKYISNSGICSRRDADALIASGQISVNDQVITELGYKVKRDDVVKYNKKVLQPEKMVYLLLNKPKDYITTTDDPENRKTIMELVKDAGSERIYPVGRLDRNTTGLIMLTNDGELADKLAHPSNNVKKIYQVDLNKPISQTHLDEIKKGIVLEDGVAIVDDIEVLSSDKTILGVEIHIGRNRIVRRIFEHLGYEVVRLDRVMYAGLTKKDLPRGRYRFLTDKEVINLKHLQK